MRKWINSSTETASTYATWAAMKRRCYNPEDKDYSRYGARGIQVCERWIADYDAFYDDMGARPFQMTLERLNTEGHYEPSNCAWVDRETQSNNRRNNRMFEGATVARQARKFQMSRQAMLYRADKGIPANQPKRIAEAQHGTVSRYSSAKHQCRCADCREAWRLYHFRKRG